MKLSRAYTLLEIKEADDDKRIVEGIATTPTPDRVGDIIEPKGAEFDLPIPFLWQHNSREPIGHVIEAKVTSDGIRIKAQLAKIAEPGQLKDRLDEAWQSIKAGLVRGLSIGFKPIESARINETYAERIMRWMWLELSAVTIAANGDASITAIKALDAKQRAASGRSAAGVRLLPPGVSGKQPPKPKAKEPDMKTLAEQIAALEATRAAKAARMEEVMQKSIDEGRSTDAAESDEFDTLSSEVEAIDADLKRLRALERTKAAAAKPVSGLKPDEGSDSRAGIVTIKNKPKLDKGIGFAQFAMCLGSARGNLMQAQAIAKSRFPDNEELNISLKAAVDAGTTTDPLWAAPLVDSYQRFAGDFVEFLRPMTIIGKFGQGGIPSLRRVPFNISIAGQTSGGSGYWVGEAAAKPLTRFEFETTNLRWAKVANIAVITEELLRFSNPSAEMLVRDSLAKALIERLDIDFVDPAKSEATNVSPASITNGVTAINSSGTTADAIRDDVRALMALYIAANITPTNGVWIMPATTALALSQMRNALGQKEFPDITMLGGTFEGLPVIVSEYVPTDSFGATVILANASDIWLADDGQVVIDASREASLEMDSAPTSQTDSPPVAASLVSMFQTNSVAIRAERWINWKKRRAQAVQMLDNVLWGT